MSRKKNNYNDNKNICTILYFAEAPQKYVTS